MKTSLSTVQKQGKYQRRNRKVGSKNSMACVLLLLGLSCAHERRVEERRVFTKDSIGNIYSEIGYINDTVKHGIAKYYYPDSKKLLKDEIEFNHGIREGWHKQYRRDGTMESKAFYKNNVQDGAYFWYHVNGKIKSESFWIKNKQYGAEKRYYQNGQIESFAAIDLYGEYLYFISWDSLGNKREEDGLVFSKLFIVTYFGDSVQTPIAEDAIKAGKEVIIKIATAQPPHTQTIIRMGELGKGNRRELPIENYTAIYKQTFTAGKHTLVTTGEIKDEQGHVVKRDSTSGYLNVIE